jgi:hypothetical protein
MLGVAPLAAVAGSITLRNHAPVSQVEKDKHRNAPLWVPGMPDPLAGEIRRVREDHSGADEWMPAVYNGSESDPAFYVL